MLIIAVFFIWLSLGRISYEDRLHIWNTMLTSKKIWLITSMLIGVLAHWIRAIRWNYLLQPIGYTIPKASAFSSIMAGYFANLGIPRTGEILRASLIHKKEKIPFQQLFGTIITERFIDLLMLLLITLISISINTDILLSFLEENNINPIKTISIISALIIGGYLFFKLINKFKTFKNQKILNFITDLFEGISSIKKMPNKQHFIILTIMIWICYVAMFFVTKYCIDGTSKIPLSVIIITFVIGSFAMTISNGGLGAFPFFIAATLTNFNIENTDSEAFGWLLWSSQTFLNILLGILGLLYFTFSNKKTLYYQNLKNK